MFARIADADAALAAARAVQARAGRGEGDSLFRALRGGNVLILEDGSVWQVDSLGRVGTCLSLGPAAVTPGERTRVVQASM